MIGQSAYLGFVPENLGRSYGPAKFHLVDILVVLPVAEDPWTLSLGPSCMTPHHLVRPVTSSILSCFGQRVPDLSTLVSNNYYF